MNFKFDELTAVIDALALPASRRESQARAVKYGRHHDEAAVKLRLLRLRFIQERLSLTNGRKTDA